MVLNNPKLTVKDRSRYDKNAAKLQFADEEMVSERLPDIQFLSFNMAIKLDYESGI